MAHKKTTYLAQAGMIAAVYAAATLVALLLLQGLAWGPVQFRISEAVCVLAALTPAAVPGLTVGCAIANLMARARSACSTWCSAAWRRLPGHGGAGGCASARSWRCSAP